MYKRYGLSGLAVLGLMAGAAQAEVQPGFYAGAAIGQASIKVDDVGFDESDTAFKVFGGYTFNDYFALEAAYFDGGAPKMSSGGASVDAELTGLMAAAVGRLPLGESFSVFGKLGFTSYDFKVNGRVDGQTVASFDGSDEEVLYGVGAAMSFAQSFELRAEYEALDVSGGEYSVLSLSGVYRF